MLFSYVSSSCSQSSVSLGYLACLISISRDFQKKQWHDSEQVSIALRVVYVNIHVYTVRNSVHSPNICDSLLNYLVEIELNECFLAIWARKNTIWWMLTTIIMEAKCRNKENKKQYKWYCDITNTPLATAEKWETEGARKKVTIETHPISNESEDNVVRANSYWRLHAVCVHLKPSFSIAFLTHNASGPQWCTSFHQLFCNTKARTYAYTRQKQPQRKLFILKRGAFIVPKFIFSPSASMITIIILN